jgi:hypothetical protein
MHAAAHPNAFNGREETTNSAAEFTRRQPAIRHFMLQNPVFRIYYFFKPNWGGT